MVDLLRKARGKPVSDRKLYDCVHGPGVLAGRGQFGYRVNVRQFICRIRKKLTAAGIKACIVNCGHAYRMESP